MSLAEKLANLVNPEPIFQDPEIEQDQTAAKVEQISRLVQLRLKGFLSRSLYLAWIQILCIYSVKRCFIICK